MNKELIDKTIEKIGRGHRAAMKSKDKHLIDMGNDIIDKLLELAKHDSDPELLKYVIEQMTIKSPSSINELSEIVKTKHPEYLKHLEKLMLLL